MKSTHAVGFCLATRDIAMWVRSPVCLAACRDLISLAMSPSTSSPGEAPLAAAKRELIEETGVRARKWSRLVQYYASPGFLSEYFHVFLAEDLRSGVAEPEEDEKIELLRIPLSELLLQIADGKVQDGKTIVSVLLFSRKIFSKQK